MAKGKNIDWSEYASTLVKALDASSIYGFWLPLLYLQAYIDKYIGKSFLPVH
jgi:hypothetical protein